MNRHHPGQARKSTGTRDLAHANLYRKRALTLATLLLAGISTAGLSVARATSTLTRASRGSHTPTAVAARELTVRETANLHLVSHHRETIVEEGRGTGTLNGNLVVHLTLAYTQASVTFTAYPPGGTISGRGEGSTNGEGNTAHFTGTATIIGGTGKYAHASASDVRIQGTLQRRTFAFFIRVTAKLRY
jgi:hypothetical protein